MAKLLIVEDEAGLRSFLQEALEMAGHDVTCASDGEAGAQRLRQEAFDVMFTDLNMPKLSGMELLRMARALQPELQVIVITAYGTVDTAVEAMKLGAFDYLPKPLSGLAELRLLVTRALERKRLHATQERHARSTPPVPPLTYGDPVMAPIVDALRKVAATNATVLLLGESGCGKEVAARSIHNWSSRAQHPFVAVNCTALAESLLESELFGHEKGAFTGATQRRQGRLELAAGGTFFLDEVGELKPDLQVKLLRVIEERRFERVGGSLTLDADVRWIAATNRDLPRMVAAGTFREDLFHRLAVFPVLIPPLRERMGDLLPLAKMLLQNIAAELGRGVLQLDATAEQKLAQSPWRGNVRELRNALERAAILADGSTLSAHHFVLVGSVPPPPPPPPPSSPPHFPPPLPAASPHLASASSDPVALRFASHPPKTLDDLERLAIIDALTAVGGNRRQAAERLGIGLRTLYDKLKRYDIG